MAASKFRVYPSAKKYLLTGQIDLDTSAMRWKICAASKAAAVSANARSTFASLTHVTAWVGTDIRTLSGIAVTVSGGSNTIRVSAAARIWTASANLSVQYAVFGVSGGKALGWVKLSSAAITVTAGNTLTITPNTAGLFNLTGGVTS